MAADMSLAVDAVRFAMSLEQLRAKIAAHNIAMANVPGGQTMRLSGMPALSSLRSLRQDPQLFAQALRSLQDSELTAHVQSYTPNEALALDSAVADLSAASGRYQALADGVSRQFALMQLAIRGGR